MLNVDRAIAEIDDLITEQLTVILQHKALQQLEASWRGVHYLAEQAHALANPRIKLKLLAISATEIEKDVGSAIEFDQSQLFHKIYHDEFDHPGGEPYGLLIGDYYLNHRIPSACENKLSIHALSLLSHIAAASFAPLVISVDAAFFGLNNFNEMPLHINLDQLFQHQAYDSWKRFRDSEDSRFIGLSLPRVLMRAPYQEAKITPALVYNQIVTAKSYVWGNASYCYAAVVLRSFAHTNWLADTSGLLTGKLAGGLVTDRQGHRQRFELPQLMPRYSIEYAISDSFAKAFSLYGFLVLSHCKYTHYSGFYSSYSANKAKQHTSQQASSNAKLSNVLRYILCASRFAHYIKILVRNKIGTFSSAQECELMLQNWLLQYAAGGHDLSEDLKARKPLRHAKVSVLPKAGHSGYFRCVIHLQPHYQIENMDAQMQLVTELKVC